MSYTTINGMRSARFPLQGNCECGCPAMGPCPTSLRGEEEARSIAAGASGGLLLLFGIGALIVMGTAGGRRRST